MSESVNDKKIFSLLQVMKSIQKTLSERYKTEFWVKAEMNKLNLYRHSGHCYPELVEKQGEKVVAQIRSILWKDDFIRINNQFLKILQEPLKDGIKILFLANITFDPVHGLSLRILDIDAGYTLGDLEREKQETIQKLQLEGIFNRNKLIKIPLLLKRIAIISVETSKGYADFIKVIETNPWNYKVFHMLFPSVLQGEKAITSITAQLKRIERVKDHFDAVAIIRGGGGDVGLSCYNNYMLAKQIAEFPLPVITGIGHATNLTVAEMIAYENAITPTKIAEYVLQKFHNLAVPVQNAETVIANTVVRIIHDQKIKLRSTTQYFRAQVTNKLLQNKNTIRQHLYQIVQHTTFLFKNQKTTLNYLSEEMYRSTHAFSRNANNQITAFKTQLKTSALNKIKQQQTELIFIEKNIDNMRPEKVLKRGFSITYHQGKVINSGEEIAPGDLIQTITYSGSIESKVTIIKKESNEK